MLKDNYRKKSFLLRVKSTHQLLEKISIKDRVLDIGCGTGELISSISAKYKLRAVGIDVSSEIISQCKEKYLQPNLEFKHGDILTLPFQDHSFDVVLSISLIEWITEYKKAISEIARITTPSGSWIVSIPNWRSPFRKLQKVLSRFQADSYLHFQKNQLDIELFIELAGASGFKEKERIYQILPFVPKNIHHKLFRKLGMMCMLILVKEK